MAQEVADAARQLLEELEAGWLEVAKIPSRRGGYIRVPMSKNAEWYSRLCRTYESATSKRFPKPRTIIKRCHTIAALRRLIDGRRDGEYYERLRPFIEDVLEEQTND